MLSLELLKRWQLNKGNEIEHASNKSGEISNDLLAE